MRIRRLSSPDPPDDSKRREAPRRTPSNDRVVDSVAEPGDADLGHERSRSPPLLKGTLHLGPIIVPRQYIIILTTTIVAVALLYTFMRRTGFGTAMRAAADNPYAARVVGIPEDLVNATTWGIGASIAGVAGVMVAPIFGAYFFLGLTVGIKGFAAAVVGGFGRPYGALAGGLLLGVVETLGAAYISSAWKDAFAMAILVLFRDRSDHTDSSERRHSIEAP